MSTPTRGQDEAAKPATALATAPADDDALVVRTDPPKLDDFESDRDKDGVPDGWYNLRDATIVQTGGVVGPRFVRFQCDRAGRPARLSRAFGVDGRKYEAMLLGLWIRLEREQYGERLGEEPGLLIDFLGPALRQTTRGTLGPWTSRSMAGYTGWTRVAKRLPISPETRDAILSVGLLGATGILDIDGMTVELVPRGDATTTNLVTDPGFELGDPNPSTWVLDNGARRAFPGDRSDAALELSTAGARAMTGLALPVDRIPSLAIGMRSRGQGLRGGGGGTATVFFVDEDGRPLPGFETGLRALSFAGNFDWRDEQTAVTVPPGAVRAVLQIDKTDRLGTLKIDEVTVTALPDAAAGTWSPYHVAPESEGWKPVVPSTGIEKGSALDFSFLLDGPAGKHGSITVKNGRFHYTKGGFRARFLGVQLLPPTAYLSTAQADALADRLARSGINLVRLGDLDTPLGPERSLFDDTRDDTSQLDLTALARLDHLIAALKARGIYVAVELLSARRYRTEDGVAMPGALPPGGGPAAVFDPILTKKAQAAAKALLDHVNPETKVAWKNEPALAWITLSGEVSLFNLIDDPNALPGDYAKAYRALAAQSTTGTGRRFWQGLETAHWSAEAAALHKAGLKAPVAGVSHYRREREFSEAQQASGLDLVDDRIFWNAPSWVSPGYRSFLWSLDGGLIAEANRKRKADKPYALGQWCDFTQGVWASPYDAAEQILAARTAAAEDWDALVRRGVFVYPEAWGSSAPGTFGGEDIFQVPAVANAAPHVFALWPHQASILGRAEDPRSAARDRARTEPNRSTRGRRSPVAGWEPERGRFVVNTPFTQGIAGWPAGETAKTENLEIDVDNRYGVVVASSASTEPIARTKRLLVTAIANVAPTGFKWVDEWRRLTADPGRPPLLREPVMAQVVWKHKGPIKAYELDNNGRRVGAAKLETRDDGVRLVIDGTSTAFHWELVVE